MRRTFLHQGYWLNAAPVLWRRTDENKEMVRGLLTTAPAPASARPLWFGPHALCPSLLFLLQRLHWSLPRNPLLVSEPETHPSGWVIPFSNLLWFQDCDQDSELKAAAKSAAKLLQSFPTLRDPINGSPSGSTIPGILQARTLEWVAISFSKAWKWKVKVKSPSRVRLLATPWTAAYQAPLSMGFSRQEYWRGVPLPSPN